jgi:hypothetical protein
MRAEAAGGASAAVAVPFAIASFLVVFDFRIGPVVLVVSQRHSHGVHLGDLLIGVPFGLVAMMAALVALIAFRTGRR